MAARIKKAPLQRSLPWKKLHSSMETAFSPSAAGKIAAKHNLPEGSVIALGKALVYPLSEKFFVLGLLKPLYEEQQGERKREELLRLLRRAVADLDKVHDIARRLRSSDLRTALAYTELGKGRTLTQITRLDWYREEIEKRVGESKTWDEQAVNHRRESDEIRPSVLAELFRFWSVQGRPVTITTTDRKGSDRRSGKLLEFATDVVKELTDPPTPINGETFRKDLEGYKESLEIRDSFSADFDLN